MHDPLDFLFTGSAGHLWFFPAYVLAVLILSLFIFLKKEKYIIPFGALLYTVGLLGRSYTQLPLGFEVDNFVMFRGPFIGTLFVAIGWRLSKVDFSVPDRRRIALAVMLIFAGLLIQFAENWFLWKYYAMAPEHSFLFGMIPLGIGLFLFAMTWQNIGRLTYLSVLGRYTLGVFAFHMIFTDTLLPFRSHFEPILWDILYPIAVYFLSFVSTLLLMKFPWGRKLVAQGRSKRVRQPDKSFDQTRQSRQTPRTHPATHIH